MRITFCAPIDNVVGERQVDLLEAFPEARLDRRGQLAQPNVAYGTVRQVQHAEPVPATVHCAGLGKVVHQRDSVGPVEAERMQAQHLPCV